MPTISVFYGIMIRMFLNDHNPPHFHAVYGDYTAAVAIQTGDVIRGWLPKTASRLVKEWALQHQQALLDNWALAQHDGALHKIGGLDDRTSE